MFAQKQNQTQCCLFGIIQPEINGRGDNKKKIRQKKIVRNAKKINFRKKVLPMFNKKLNLLKGKKSSDKESTEYQYKSKISKVYNCQEFPVQRISYCSMYYLPFPHQNIYEYNYQNNLKKTQSSQNIQQQIQILPLKKPILTKYTSMQEIPQRPQIKILRPRTTRSISFQQSQQNSIIIDRFNFETKITKLI